MFNKSFHIIFNKYYFSQISSLKESSIKHSSIGIHNGSNIFTPKFSYPLKNGKGSQAFSTFVLRQLGLQLQYLFFVQHILFLIRKFSINLVTTFHNCRVRPIPFIVIKNK